MSDTLPLFSQCQQSFWDGHTARDDFWRLAHDHHRHLADYASTLADSDVAAIEITAGGLSLRLKSGVRLLWNPEDIRSSANTLVNHGRHEAEDSRFLLAAARGKRCIFDIGANAGYYALHFAHQFPEVQHIHAFEPIPGTYETLVHNIGQNNQADKITANNLALGAAEGEVRFYVPAFSGSCAASLKNLHPGEANLEVSTRMTTLDAYCETHQIQALDLMKIDVEGAEFFVFEGAQQTLARFKPTLFVEILRKWSRQFGIEPNQTIARLRALGYQCWTVDNGTLVPFKTMTEETPQTNFFFTHPDREPDPTRWVC